MEMLLFCFITSNTENELLSKGDQSGGRSVQV